MGPAEGFCEAASVEPDSAEADLAEPDLGGKAMPTAAEDAAPEVADEPEMPAEALAVTEVGSTDAPNAGSDHRSAAMAALNAGDEAVSEPVPAGTPRTDTRATAGHAAAADVAA